MSDVFVSYSRRDKGFVLRLHEELTRRGKDVWVDWEDIPPTAEWFDEIRRGIDAADGFVYVVSPDSVASDVCRQEIDYAAARGKRVIPILHRELPGAAEVPELAAAHNWIFFRDEDPFDEATDTLVRAMETDLEHTHAHTAWLQAAVDWERHDRDRSRLVRGRELDAGEAWLAASPGKQPEPTALQRDFLLASRRAAGRRQRMLVGGVSVALAVAIALAVVALVQRSNAVTQQRAALASALAANAKLVEETDPELGVLLAVEGARVSPGERTTETLREQLLASHLRRTWEGHGENVRQVAFSPDGSVAAGTTSDDTTRLQDVATGEEIATLDTPGTAGQVAFAPRGGLLATGGLEVALWDARTGELVRKLETPGALDVAFSADGGRLVTAGTLGDVTVWDTRSGRRLRVLRGHRGPVLSVDVTARGDRVVSGGSDGTMRVFDVRAGTERWSSRVPGRFVADVAFSPDGRLVRVVPAQSVGRVLAADDGREVLRTPDAGGASAFSPDSEELAAAAVGNLVNVYDIASGRVKTSLVGHSALVKSVAYTPLGDLVTTSGDRTARLWEGIGGREIRRFAGHRGDVGTAAVSADGSRLLTGAEDGTMRLWAAAEQPVRRIDPDEGLVSVTVSRDGRRAVAGGGEGTVRAFALDDGRELWAAGPRSAAIAGTGLNADGSLVIDLAAGEGSPARLTVSDAANGRELAAPSPPEGEVTAAAFDEGGGRLLVGGDRGTAAIADARTGRELAVLDGPRPPVVEAGFSPDGDLALTGHADGIVALWDAASGRQLRTLPTAGATVLAAAFGPDGGLLATASGAEGVEQYTERGTLEVWDTRTGRRLHTLAGHALGVTSISFAREGDLMATGSLDGTVRIWSTVTWRPLHELDHAAPEVRGVAEVHVSFSEDGRILLAHGGLKARAWEAATGLRVFSDDMAAAAAMGENARDIVTLQSALDVFACELCGDREELLDLAERRVSRELTPEERERYLGDDA